MKYLKYILLALVVLFLAFLLVGVVKPTVDYDCEVQVDKPLTESWSVTQDEAKMSDWLEGFQRVEHVSGTPGNVGAVSRVYFLSNGQENTIQETITAINPNESISMLFESDFMNMDYTMKMTEENGTTKIKSSTSAHGNGIFSKSIMALMAGSIKGQEETNLNNLKRVIEENDD